MSEFEFPQLERLFVRPEKEAEDKEIWSPSWRCFCCHDTGKIAAALVKKIIPDYDYHKDKQPFCQRCLAGAEFVGDENYDQRFKRAICDRLDSYSRKSWAETINSKQQFKVEKKLAELAKAKAMPGTKPRTDNDNREVLQRKAEIEAITHEQWIAQGQEYFQGHLEEYSNEMS